MEKRQTEIHYPLLLHLVPSTERRSPQFTFRHANQSELEISESFALQSKSLKGDGFISNTGGDCRGREPWEMSPS
jgi:hypothetical protein